MSRLGARPGPKSIVATAMLGEKGVTLVTQRVLDMGYAWTATTAAFDSGIDGYIEIRDPETSQALNQIVQVQVKATDGRWSFETDKAFQYLCDERDLNYWRRGNAPVLLVVTRPKTGEAYWVNIKEYFKTPAAQKERRVYFNKETDRFDKASASAIRKAAVSTDAGLYVSPTKKTETLISNLLPITRLPRELFYGATTLGSGRDIQKALGENSQHLREFSYRGKWILSAHDLTSPEWRGVVDRGTVESFATAEWSQTDDPDRLNSFIDLLQRCLSERLYRLGMKRDPSKDYFYFRPTKDLSERRLSYVSIKRPAERSVFKKYVSKKGKVFFRHTALHTQIRRYDSEWKLTLSPTYRFTADGLSVLRHYESKLKGIKALENNNAVLGQVAFFASILADKPTDLFATEEAYPHLGFGALERVTLDVGIEDATWLPREPETVDEETLGGAEDDAELALLFADDAVSAGDGE